MEESNDKTLVTHGSIHEKVANQIKGAGSHVENALIEALVSSEVSKRIQIAQAGLKAITTLKADLNKANHPDVKTYTAERVEIRNYSEARYKQIEQLKQTLEKTEKAFNRALNENTGEAYGELDKLSKNTGGGKSDPSAEA